MFGQLGNGSTVRYSDTPVKVALPGDTRVQSVRVGCDHDLALTATGRVLAWGSNVSGQLGDGSTKSRRKPVRVRLPKGTTVQAVRAGCGDSLALTTRGRMLAWGDGSKGELGDGSTKDRQTPVSVSLPGKTKIKAISAGCGFNLALTTGGRVLAWGRNGDGELGNGKEPNGTSPARHRPVFVKLPKRVRVTSIAAGCAHALAGAAGGAIWAWGSNLVGQLGDGTTKNRHTPVSVRLQVIGPRLGKLKSLAAGCFHSLALFSAGSVLAWGAGVSGQLGDGSTSSSTRPVRVMLPTGVKAKAISAGCNHSMALTTTGTVLTWGADIYGELGNGDDMNEDVPVTASLSLGLSPIGLGGGPAAFGGVAIVQQRP
jgi:alpha-tubulin suppressor-like RCC1 family protein